MYDCDCCVCVVRVYLVLCGCFGVEIRPGLVDGVRFVCLLLCNWLCSCDVVVVSSVRCCLCVVRFDLIVKIGRWVCAFVLWFFAGYVLCCVAD